MPDEPFNPDVLSVRGIPADEAYRCCRRQRLEVASLLYSVAGLLQGQIDGRWDVGHYAETKDVALFVPTRTRELPIEFRPTPEWEPIIRQRTGRPIGVGVVIIVITAAILAVDAVLAALAKAHLDLLRRLADAISDAVQSTSKSDPCKACIERHLWTQSNQRVKDLVLGRRRIR